MKDWFERNRLAIFFGVAITLVVIAVVVICILAEGGNGEFNVSQWTANPANPASPVSKLLH